MFDYRVGGVQSGQNLDYVIYEQSLREILGFTEFLDLFFSIFEIYLNFGPGRQIGGVSA